MLTVWIMLDVKKTVVTPSLLLTSELDALLRVLRDRDVAKPMPVDVF